MSKKWVFKHRHPQAEQAAAPVTQGAAMGEDPAPCSSPGVGLHLPSSRSAENLMPRANPPGVRHVQPPLSAGASMGIAGQAEECRASSQGPPMRTESAHCRVPEQRCFVLSSGRQWVSKSVCCTDP